MAEKKCCIGKCYSSSTREEDNGVTYHKFPKDIALCTQWETVTNFKHTQSHTTAYVCSRHFCKRDFKKNLDSKYVLKSDAVPSIFQWNMDTQIETVESLDLDIQHEDPVNSIAEEKSLLSSSKDSESENLEAIRKYIEQQEKEIQDLQAATAASRKKAEQAKNLKNAVNHAENLAIATTVMDMILTESEAKIANAEAKVVKKELKPALNPDKKEPKMLTSGTSCMSLSIGSKVEAKDFGDEWHPAVIVELDYEEMEVLVRFDVNMKKQDEWISVSSTRLRPISDKVKAETESRPVPSDEVKEPAPVKVKEEHEPVKDEKHKVVFEVGERCLARWRDNRRFMATVNKDLGDGKYEIIFDDGFHWTCSALRLSKMKTEKDDPLSVDTMHQATSGAPSPLDQRAGPSNPHSPTPIFHTHLFDPATDYLGSKSERREKKRKLDIKQIFNIGQKKSKVPKVEKEKVQPKSIEKKPTVVKSMPKVKSEGKNDTKHVVKQTIPDAVASIIGTVSKEDFKSQGGDQLKEDENEAKDEISKELNEKIEYSDIIDTTTADDINTKNISKVKEVCDDYVIEIAQEVNPNDEIMDDEDGEPKSEGDPVLEEEKLENFEKPDTARHEMVIDKIKEAINKLEGGLVEMEKINSPKIESVETPVPESNKPEEVPETIPEPIEETPETKDEIKEVKEEENLEVNVDVPKVESLKRKRDPSKMKKSKKLRLLQEKKVNRQVEQVKNELEVMKRKFEAMRKHMLLKTREFVQSNECSVMLPGEWCCRWVNGQPVGEVSELAPEPRADNNKPALPRRSVQVEDKRLPPGWTKHMVRRSVGNSAGKWDVVLVSPEYRRFHTKTDMRNFLEHNTDEALKPYEYALMDFGVHLKLARRLGWITNTPDGQAKPPETILPADATSTLHISPLVKRRKPNIKRSLKMKEKKRRPIKLKLQKRLDSYNSHLVGDDFQGEGNQFENENPEPLLPLEDGYVYVGSLKVQIIENLLRCPADGCFKNFRTKTLLQMHIKHYHRELIAKMGATPKVLDLAYARARPNAALQPKDRRVMKVKILRPTKRERDEKNEPKLEPEILEMPRTPEKQDDNIPRMQDSPKLRDALINKPVKRPRVLLPVRRPDPEAVPVLDAIEEDDFNNTEQYPTEPVEIPFVEALDFETAISTHTVTKPVDRKKKGDKKKSFATVSKTVSEDEEWFTMNSDDLETMSSFPRSGSPDSKMMDIKLQPMSSESYDDTSDLYTYTETGERVKIEHMKREEIINCHCGVREEDGLMVQCELCLCWQHAHCHNIQRECDVPAKYTCSICLNPRRGRRSARFLHDQDRMYEGLLPNSTPLPALRRAHELSGNLLRLSLALHATRVKCYVAHKKDHPKLYLWAKDWEQAELAYTQERLNSDYTDLNIMINGMDKENLPVRPDDDPMGIRTPPSEDQEADRLSHRDNQLVSHSLLSGLLTSPGGGSLELPISTSELERLAKSVQESAEWRGGGAGAGAGAVGAGAAVGPQPEAAIESGACRQRLLRHLQRCHVLLDTRLDSIEAHIAELESQDPTFGENYETAESYPRVKQTVQMLLRDLDTLEELAIIT